MRALRAISPILEHVILSAASLTFFILVVVSFNTLQSMILKDDLENRLENMADQVALAVSQSYQTGVALDEVSSDLPTSKIFVQLPATLTGYQFSVRYEGGQIIASSKGKEVSAELLGLDRDVTITGKITGSPVRKPSVSYYKGRNLIVLENSR